MRLTVLLFVVVLITSKLFAQCPNWIGSSIESAKQLKALIQRQLQATLSQEDSFKTKQYKALIYKDKKGPSSFSIGWYVKETTQLTSALEPVVSDITIKGPADKIDKLITDLSLQAKNCAAFSIGANWVKFSNYIIGWGSAPDNDGKAMKFISVKPISLK